MSPVEPNTQVYAEPRRRFHRGLKPLPEIKLKPKPHLMGPEEVSSGPLLVTLLDVGAVSVLGHLSALADQLMASKFAVQGLGTELRRLKLAEAAKVFEVLRGRIMSGDDFTVAPTGVDGMTVLVKAHPDLQSNLLDALPTRLVAPRVRSRLALDGLPHALCPTFSIDGVALVLLPHEAGAIEARLLKRRNSSLLARAHDIVGALDAVLSGV